MENLEEQGYSQRHIGIINEAKELGFNTDILMNPDLSICKLEFLFIGLRNNLDLTNHLFNDDLMNVEYKSNIMLFASENVLFKEYHNKVPSYCYDNLLNCFKKGCEVEDLLLSGYNKEQLQQLLYARSMGYNTKPFEKINLSFSRMENVNWYGYGKNLPLQVIKDACNDKLTDAQAEYMLICAWKNVDYEHGLSDTIICKKIHNLYNATPLPLKERINKVTKTLEEINENELIIDINKIKFEKSSKVMKNGQYMVVGKIELPSTDKLKELCDGDKFTLSIPRFLMKKDNNNNYHIPLKNSSYCILIEKGNKNLIKMLNDKELKDTGIIKALNKELVKEDVSKSR